MLRIFLIISLLGLCTESRAASTDLMGIYLKVLESDPNLEVSRLQLAISEARHQFAEAQLLPQVSASVTFSENDVDSSVVGQPSQSFSGRRFNLQVQQSIYDRERLFRRDRTRDIMAQRGFERANTEGEILIDTANRYFRVLQAIDELALTVAEQDFVERQKTETQKLYDLVLVPVTQVFETIARADQIRSDVIQAEANLKLAQEELAMLTGEPVKALVKLSDRAEFPAISEPLAELIDYALANNQNLRARQQAVQATAAQIGEAEATYWPTVSLVLGAEQSNIDLDNLQIPERDNLYLGLNISASLFAGGSTKAAVSEARLVRRLVRQELEIARREIIQRTQVAYLNAQTARARIEASVRAVTSAEKFYDSMQKGFRLGSVTSVDVLDALRQQTEAKRNLQRARYQFIGHYLALRQQLGAASLADMKQVNGWLNHSLYPEMIDDF